MNNHVILFSLILICTIIIPLNPINAVEDNAVIEGTIDPLLYSEEIYVIRVTPTDESRDIKFSVYSRIGKISSQEQNIPRGTNYVNFYLKFFPPLYKIDEKYTLEVTGSGVIGRSTITIREDPSVSDAQKIKEQQIAEERARQEEQARLAQQKAEEERQARMAQQKAQEEENARLAEETAKERERQLEQSRKEQEDARIAKQKAQEEENARLAEEIAKERERQLEQARQNPEIQNDKTTTCGEGTILENGICIRQTIDDNNSNESETPAWMFLLPVVLLIVIITIIQKTKKKKNRPINQQSSFKKQNNQKDKNKKSETLPKGYDNESIKNIRDYNKETFNKNNENKITHNIPKKSNPIPKILNDNKNEFKKQDPDIIKKINEQIQSVNKNRKEIDSSKKEIDTNSIKLKETQEEKDFEIKKLDEINLHITNKAFSLINEKYPLEKIELYQIKSDIKFKIDQIDDISKFIEELKTSQKNILITNTKFDTLYEKNINYIIEHEEEIKNESDNTLIKITSELEEYSKYQKYTIYELQIKNWEEKKQIHITQKEILDTKLLILKLRNRIQTAISQDGKKSEISQKINLDTTTSKRKPTLPKSEKTGDLDKNISNMEKSEKTERYIPQTKPDILDKKIEIKQVPEKEISKTKSFSLKLADENDYTKILKLYNDEKLIWNEEIKNSEIKFSYISENGDVLFVRHESNNILGVKLTNKKLHEKSLLEKFMDLKFSGNIVLLKDLSKALHCFEISDNEIKLLWKMGLEMHDRYYFEENKIVVESKTGIKKSTDMGSPFTPE